MVTQTQLTAKLEARQHFRGMRFFTEQVGADAPTMPLNTALAGIGVASDAVRIYVLEDQLNEVDVPVRFGELHTELVPTPGFQAGPPAPVRSARPRPANCGISVGHVNTTAGTLGCLVDIDGDRYVLSNNHVLANTNAGEIGDHVVQPGPADGGIEPGDVIARLDQFERIDFGVGAINHIDAAIAGLVDSSFVNPDIMTIGCPASLPMVATLGQSVAKHGRTTGFTTGHVVDESFDGYVGYTSGNAWFENQIVVQSAGASFSQPGDSGSLIVDISESRPVALLFAGDGRNTLGNPIELVLTRFGAAIVDR